MATYAVGDPQGCYDELQRLLEGTRFDPARDRLWCVGDLVNRGPASLEVLRFFRSLGERAVCVLGNHDLHLLAVAAGQGERQRPKDTLEGVLGAPDRAELVEWLRHRPMVHRDPDLGFSLLHAGLPPEWSMDDALAYGAELEAVLRSPRHLEFFRAMYGNTPERWSHDLQGWERLRFITNCFTRLRFVAPDGRLDLKSKGPPGSQRPGFIPWYEVSVRRSRGERIVFGHWSTLQLHARVPARHRVYPLDSGCVWGGQMTALRLEDERWFSVPCSAG